MIKSYFLIGWRNLLRGKAYSFINIGGLAMGMAVAMLIVLWVHTELRYNTSFDHYKRIGMIYHNLDFGGEIITYEGTPYVMGSELKNNFAEFEEVVVAVGPQEHVVSLDEKRFSRTSYYTDTNFPELFSLSMVQGTRDGLKDKNSIMLAKSTADAFFNSDALEKSLKFDNRDLLTVTGVFEDFPETSQFADVKMIVPIEYYFSLSEDTQHQRTSWEAIDPICFVLLNENTSWETAEAKIKNFLFEKSPESIKSWKPEAIIHPMEKWNLYADFKDGKNVGGKIQFVWMLGLVGVFVLGLACINFVNLSTARSEKRSKEVGIRKTMGSLRNQLVRQFMTESLLVVLLAFALAILLVVCMLPGFNLFVDTKIEVPWLNYYFLIFSIVFILLTSLIAGSYPALYLSSFNPVKVLKGSFKAGRYAALPRKVLVVFQFVISTALIIGTWVVFQQVQHAKSRTIGFDLEGIIQVELKTDELANVNYNSLRHDLLSTGVVENMAISDSPMTGNMSADASLTWEGKDPNSQPIVAMNRCSHDFSATNGFQFLSGRDFSRDYSTDSSAVIVNEMAANLFSPTGNAIGMKLTWGENDTKIEREIIGVIKDQIRWSPFEKQSPHIYFVDYVQGGFLTVRFKEGADTRNALEKVEAVLTKYDPASPFEYEFQDDEYASLFESEEHLGKLASIFSGLAVFISCIGIFGLASFAASQRTKEIGIRKILGASVFNVWKLLSSDFFWLVILSSVISCPIAYYYANQWLQQYDYRIEISWTIFIITCSLLLMITLLTVSFQSIKAALSNPVESLRSE